MRLSLDVYSFPRSSPVALVCKDQVAHPSEFSVSLGGSSSCYRMAASVNSVVGYATFLRAAPINGVSQRTVRGLPAMSRARGRSVRCSSSEQKSTSPARNASAALLAAAAAGMASPALALVDERLSTEGTGLSLGISNNLLAWILLGVFGLIWALFFVYTSTLDEDEDSGLSL